MMRKWFLCMIKWLTHFFSKSELKYPDALTPLKTSDTLIGNLPIFQMLPKIFHMHKILLLFF